MIVIGEHINVITKKIAKAMQERDPAPILEMARIQKDAGADYLDLNIGPARKGGPELMEWLVETIQGEMDIPCSLDTTNAEAIEAGLKVHKGKAIINSTSASRSRMEKTFPLAAKYNAFIIGLTLGERGMPKDSNERCALAMDVIMGAAEFGVSPEDIFLDPIFLTVNGMQDQAMEVLDSIGIFKDLNDPPMKSTCGLSNVSNTAPEEVRSILNRTYMVMAMQRGLTSAIMDPMDERLMELLRKAEAMGDNIVLEDILSQDELKTVEMLKGNILYCHSYLDT
jgi:5-methyltetrahydrofolate corrinoid/iron sulfur protein methyltransferase